MVKEGKMLVPIPLLDEAGIATLRLDHQGRLSFANETLARLLGKTLGELIGHLFLELLHPDSEPQDMEHLEVQATQSVDLALSHAEGHSIWFRASFIDDKDERVALLQDLTQARLVDVTERKSLEAQLRQAQKMEALGALASSISHDFNNTLMGIVGCAQLAQKNLRDNPNISVRLIEDISRSALTSAKIIRQLLTFGRKRQEAAEHIEVDPVIASIEGLLQRLVNERVSLTLDLSAPGVHVKVEPGQLEQILVNLVVNAGHAMPSGGLLTVRTSREHERLRMIVTDTGQGIPPEVRAKIFEPFFTTKPEGKGSGLGLSTVYGIIKQAGGTIDVESVPNQGSTFTVSLPHVLPPQTNAEEALPPTELSEESPEVALLVEDDPLVRLTTQHYLEQLGFQVLAAADANAALALARQCTTPPTLLLTDMGLGSGIGGAQLAVELVTLHPGIRPIYMSAHAKAKLIETGKLPPTAPALQKPFSKTQLSTLIKAVRTDPAPKPQPLAPEIAPDRTICVLLVEDYDIARMACRELLEDLGYFVLEASTAQEAYAHSEKVPIDVLLTDLGLPDQSGEALAANLRSAHPGLGVIYMSGSMLDKETLDQTAAFIEKPVELDELARCVRKFGTSHIKHRGSSA